jgi:hypothetical protein
VKGLRVVYPKPKTEPVFWRPFGWLGGQTTGAPHAGTSVASRLAAWDAGWLWLYVLAYLPVLFIARAAMKVA